MTLYDSPDNYDAALPYDGAQDGVGDATLPMVTAAGVGEAAHEGAGAATLPMVTAAGVGEAAHEGAGAATLPMVTAAGVGEAAHEGAGAATLPMVTAAGVGEAAHEGAGAATLPMVVAAGVGEAAHEGAGAATLPMVVAAGVGEAAHEGAGAATLPMLTCAGVGEVVSPLPPPQPISGSGGFGGSSGYLGNDRRIKTVRAGGGTHPWTAPPRRSPDADVDTHFLRGEKVMFESDLARQYEVSTKELLATVQRNRARFPSDFMFKLTPTEARQFLPQVVTYAFTESGVTMLANVINSPRAAEINVKMVRAFIKVRNGIASPRLTSNRHSYNVVSRLLSWIGFYSQQSVPKLSYNGPLGDLRAHVRGKGLRSYRTPAGIDVRVLRPGFSVRGANAGAAGRVFLRTPQGLHGLITPARPKASALVSMGLLTGIGVALYCLARKGSHPSPRRRQGARTRR